MGNEQLTHNELLKLLAREPANGQAWKEFVTRFHEYICAVIYRECKLRSYADDGSGVEDLAQEVYMILVRNDCDALKKFEGRWENSIYKYLATTSIRTVLYHIYKAGAQKRPPSKGKASISKSITGKNGDLNLTLEEVLSAPESSAIANHSELKEEIEDCLNRMSTQRRNGSVYKEIFKYHLYEELTPEMIHEHLGQTYSLTRIRNIITEVKKDLQKCLKHKMAET
jgi:RNA polymerase sigma factor (sigma-70 family)